jgi:hypothetical protein
MADRRRRSLLRPYDGEMEFDQLPDTLEHIYPEKTRNSQGIGMPTEEFELLKNDPDLQSEPGPWRDVNIFGW